MKLLIAGDFCDRLRVVEKIKNEGFTSIFTDVIPIIQDSDYSIVNFEFPIETTNSRPIAKLGPNLKGNKLSINAIKQAGFKCCTLANNHILDQGTKCGLETKSLIEEAGIDTVGFGNNINEASNILYVDKNGEKIAIINCCEHEFSVATETSPGAYGLNPIQQYYSIQEAKKKADYILVIVHGGHELYQLPSPRMKETYHFFIDAGADAVVNHHQHCYSGYEIYKGKLIFYGIGNFLFDGPSRGGKWNEGYLVTIETTNNTFQIHPYCQCNDTPSVQMMEEGAFRLTIESINSIIVDDQKLQERFKVYINSLTKEMEIKLSPYNNKYLQVAALRGYIPSFVRREKILEILNYTECESHKDIFIAALKSLIK